MSKANFPTYDNFIKWLEANVNTTFTSGSAFNCPIACMLQETIDVSYRVGTTLSARGELDSTTNIYHASPHAPWMKRVISVADKIAPIYEHYKGQVLLDKLDGVTV